MQILNTHYLNDGKGFNHGQATRVLKIDSPSDYDQIISNILDSGYYDYSYYQRHLGYEKGSFINHMWFLAQAVATLAPKKVLEVGCGRGEILSLLQRQDIQVQGIDFSKSSLEWAEPDIRSHLSCFDFISMPAEFEDQFDVVTGFDIWEHLHPKQLDRYIRSYVASGTEDALYFVVIPAFGKDDVFGEPFPLELEENRKLFDADEPFDHLLIEKESPPIPALGHLIWASTTWWQKKFESSGLVRCNNLEKKIHKWLDPYVPHSIKSFYIFRRDTSCATKRVEQLQAMKQPRKNAMGLKACWQRYGYPKKHKVMFRDNIIDYVVKGNPNLSPIIRARSVLKPMLKGFR